MKLTKIHIIMMLLAVLMGCSKDDAYSGAELSGTQNPDNSIVLEVQEVTSLVTRAPQIPGNMNFKKLETTGFGVYGYKGEYNNASSTPTLFTNGANTPVTFISGGTEPTTTVVHPGSWEYAATQNDIKEWEKNEKYTFFAYAPYMASNGTAPGMTTVKTDNSFGDPTIGYQVATTPAESVDLLWGIRSDNGLPWKDVNSTTSAGSVMFTFYHALCAIGYHAQVIVDKDNNLTDIEDESGIVGAIGENCKVTIKSITLEPNSANSKAGRFYQTGILNLNNTTAHTPNWGSLEGSIESFVLSGSQIDSELLDPEPADDAAVATFMGNDDIPGVTQSANTQTVIAKDASASGNEQFYMLLPYEAKDYKLTIKYFITYKTGESTYYRSEEITGTATLDNLELKAGVKYYFNMVFGFTTFKLSVLAEDWDDETINTSVVIEYGTSASQSLVKKRTEPQLTK